MNRIPARIPEIPSPILDKNYSEAAIDAAPHLTGIFMKMASEVRIHAFSGNVNNYLEIACGNGDFARHLANRVSGTPVFAEDIDELAIQYAKAHNAAPNLAFNQGSVYSLSERHKDIGCIVVRDSLHHFDELDRALTEVYRALAPNGVFTGWDLDRKRFYFEMCKCSPTLKEIAKTIKSKRSAANDKVAIEYLLSHKAVGNAIMSYMAAFTSSEVEDVLNKVGFNDVRVWNDEGYGYQFWAFKHPKGLNGTTGFSF